MSELSGAQAADAAGVLHIAAETRDFNPFRSDFPPAVGRAARDRLKSMGFDVLNQKKRL